MTAIDTGPDAGAIRDGEQQSRSWWLQLPDEQLVEAAKRLDSRAIEALMRRYNRRLFRAARSILCDGCAAEDAVQEAYIRAFTHLSRYQPTGSFAAWLTRIAINEALMLRRKLQHQPLSLEALIAQNTGKESALIAEPATCSDDSEAACARQLLEQAIDNLPLSFRTVFILREVEQLSVAETAACLDLNEATVKTRLYRARHKLRADLSRRLRREQLNLFEFAGERCDRIVAAVLSTPTLANCSAAPA